ncbi:hypothetical protein TWF102_006903 [Orbilia oligospora]|uniref:Uncharacterized protein n=1 Tax=Orbilia oligospora TaxID=2813651 RepID=A0A7C8JKG0_ORBOL|nr:hypothetical protein TWF103_005776 [Orbilia oligospora]KAF3111228.1 hypothetical protein TWF102_006903 [Orbilia oligospora]KAF3114217.1 hypothetical protein TWF706_008157 [Orbilia oligospora]KAF3137176.1 hypothetical protein TWF594_007688 [Orbilia oligospora]
MRLQVLVIGIAIVGGASAAFSEELVQQYPEWTRWQQTRVCLEKQHNPKYHQDACLSSSVGGEDGRLGVDPDLYFGRSSANTVNYTETPYEGRWSALLNIGWRPFWKDFSPDASRKYQFMIFNSPGRCLTFRESPHNLTALVNTTESIGKGFNENSTSIALGDVYFEECGFGGLDVFSQRAFPFNFFNFPDNQKFRVIAEGTERDQEPDDDLIPRKRRILPSTYIPKGLCEGRLGIFDTMERGSSALGLNFNNINTTIAWGCTNQIWSLRWSERDPKKAEALSLTIGVGGLGL